MGKQESGDRGAIQSGSEKIFAIRESNKAVVQTIKLSAFFQEGYGKFPSNYFFNKKEGNCGTLSDPDMVLASQFLMTLGFHVSLVKHQSVLILRS